MDSCSIIRPVEISSIRVIHGSTTFAYKNEIRIKSNRDYQSSKRSIIEVEKYTYLSNTKLLFIYPPPKQILEFSDSDSKKKKSICDNNFDRSNRSLVYTRGTRSREKSRYLSSGRRKQGRVQSCALSPDSPMPGQLSAVTLRVVTSLV